MTLVRRGTLTGYPDDAIALTRPLRSPNVDGVQHPFRPEPTVLAEWRLHHPRDAMRALHRDPVKCGQAVLRYFEGAPPVSTLRVTQPLIAYLAQRITRLEGAQPEVGPKLRDEFNATVTKYGRAEGKDSIPFIELAMPEVDVPTEVMYTDS